MKDNLSTRDAAALRATFDGHTLVTYRPRLIRVVDAVPDGTTDISMFWRRPAPAVLKARPSLCHGTVLLLDLPDAARRAILARVHGADRCYFHKTDLAGWSAFSAPAFDMETGSRPAYAVGGTRHITPHAGRFGRTIRGF